MTATAISSGASAPLAASVSSRIPWYVVAGLLSATSIVAGLFWDISWHRTIGRDSFWTPAHVCIYAGGVLGGTAAGWRVFEMTVLRRGAGVPFWGLQGPLGAWVAIWGALAMLTSAPFDDWWHNAYGLDVKIISPPHMVLAAGMITLVIGARLQVLALQNAPDAPRHYRWLHAYLAGAMVTMAAIVIAERTFKIYLHHATAYRAAAVVFPFMLVTAAATRLRWPLTAAAAVYTVLQLLQLWLLPLVPGTPRLGPVLNPLERMVPLDFPLLLLVPAAGMDVLLRRYSGRVTDWVLSTLLGATFVGLLLVVEWPFASFLLSPAADGRFFFPNNVGYYAGPDSPAVRRIFITQPRGELVMGLLVATVMAVLSSRLGVAWWRWMERVRR